MKYNIEILGNIKKGYICNNHGFQRQAYSQLIMIDNRIIVGIEITTGEVFPVKFNDENFYNYEDLKLYFNNNIGDNYYSLGEIIISKEYITGKSIISHLWDATITDIEKYITNIEASEVSIIKEYAKNYHKYENYEEMQTQILNKLATSDNEELRKIFTKLISKSIEDVQNKSLTNTKVVNNEEGTYNSQEFLDKVRSLKFPSDESLDTHVVFEQKNINKTTSILSQQLLESRKDLLNKLKRLNLGYDLSERLDLVEAIGRDKEILKLIKSTVILGESTILLGTSGCGKTTIVEELARIIKMQDNKFLYDKIIYKIDTGLLMEGTKYRGEYETKLNNLIKLCKESKGQIILFIDEIHTLSYLGDSEDSKGTSLNILKPHIEKGDITIIGATTPSEYEDSIGKDKAFTSRFNIVKVKELSHEQNIEIIYNFIRELEDKYKVKFDFEDNKLYILVSEILSISNHQNILKKILPIRLVKRLFKDAVASAIISDKSVVTLEDILASLFDNNEILLGNEKDLEYRIRKLLNINNKSKIITLNR